VNRIDKACIIVAGETSGDKHAARLVESIKKRERVRMVGVGGDKMKSAGVELLHHVKEMSVMGFKEIVFKVPFFRKVRRDLLKAIRDANASAVILVDYPGFNLRFARLAKREGLKVVYFISPQIWAWGKGRIRKIRRTVDLMLTIFKFEEEMYRREGVPAHFVGHPLLDEVTVPNETEIMEFRNKHSLSTVGHGTGKTGMSRMIEKQTLNLKQTKFLGLLPGSRLQEIAKILPVMLRSVKILRQQLADENILVETVIGCAPGIDDEIYEKLIAGAGVEVRLTRDIELLMASVDAGLVTSGTATLEAALHGLPIVVVYKTSLATYLIGRLLVKLKFISLVNIVAQERIVSELVQYEFKPRKAAALIKDILTKSEVAEEIKLKYLRLREILGEPGASDRAAELVLRAI
jgi:lipid-A-disaccharide synthase